MRRLLRWFTLVIAVAIVWPVQPSHAEEPHFFAHGGVVINGYDPVAYFTEGRPVRGTRHHALLWKGGTWYFASAENQRLFEMNPFAYAPEYGGYCAYSVSRGHIAAPVPDAWQIVDGKLYLYSSRQVRARWLSDVTSHIDSANANWPEILRR